MATPVAFKGSPTEGVELLCAIGRNCTCDHDPDTGLIPGTCAAHSILRDQRILDGLLVSRERRGDLSREEGLTRR